MCLLHGFHEMHERKYEKHFQVLLIHNTLTETRSLFVSDLKIFVSKSLNFRSDLLFYFYGNFSCQLNYIPLYRIQIHPFLIPLSS